MPVNIHVRTAMPEDATAIAAIYAPYVLHGVASFEVDVPEPAEILRRRALVLEHGLPYIVAEIGGEIACYSYAATSAHERPTVSPSRTRFMWQKAFRGLASRVS